MGRNSDHGANLAIANEGMNYRDKIDEGAVSMEKFYKKEENIILNYIGKIKDSVKDMNPRELFIEAQKKESKLDGVPDSFRVVIKHIIDYISEISKVISTINSYDSKVLFQVKSLTKKIGADADINEAYGKFTKKHSKIIDACTEQIKYFNEVKSYESVKDFKSGMFSDTHKTSIVKRLVSIVDKEDDLESFLYRYLNGVSKFIKARVKEEKRKVEKFAKENPAFT